MLVLGHDDAVAHFVSAGLGAPIAPPYIGLAIVRDDTIVGGYVLNDFNHANIELTAYAPGLMRLGHLRFMANYIFGQLGCRRISAHAHRKNKPSLKAIEKAGFKYEATLKGFYPTGDAVLFGLQREQCRWFT